MTNISNPFAPNCRHLPQKYTISTLQSANVADTQNGYGCIYKFYRFHIKRYDENSNYCLHVRDDAALQLLKAGPQCAAGRDKIGRQDGVCIHGYNQNREERAHGVV